MSDIAYIIAVLAAVLVATAALDLTLGRRLARHSRVLAVVLCGLAIPAVAVAAACVFYYLATARPGDGPIMALSGTLIYAALATPLTMLVSLLTIRRTRRSEA